MIFLPAGHVGGWPILRGGAQSLSGALAAHLKTLGGTILCNHEVREVPAANLVLADVSPRQLIAIAGEALPSSFQIQLNRFRYGPAAFKVDFALSSPIPWRASECSRAATVHIGGSFEQIADSEKILTSNRPFVLVGQPSLFDPSREPERRHAAWADCPVPNGSTVDYTDAIESLISRFAPGFRDCILARVVSGPADLQNWNPKSHRRRHSQRSNGLSTTPSTSNPLALPHSEGWSLFVRSVDSAGWRGAWNVRLPRGPPSYNRRP